VLRGRRAWLALIAAVGCGGDEVAWTERDVVGGTLDPGDPAVVSLAQRWGSTYYSTCTGTLITRESVLTAAHCVDSLVNSGSESSLLIYFGSQVTTGGLFLPVDRIRMHRYWLGEDSRYDIAVVHMAEEAPADVEPVTLSGHVLDQSFVGAEIRLVGFGQTDEGPGGTKRQGTTWVRAVEPTYLYLESGDVDVCFGDSGGPTFHTFESGEEQVGIATLTWDCGMGGETRVDIHLDSFVWPMVDSFEGPCAYDGNCVTDCPRSPDPDCDPCAWNGDCATGCADTDWDCPLGKGMGAACANGDECEHRICEAAPEDSRVTYCTRACEPDEAIPCPYGMECADPDNGGLRCVYVSPTPGVLGASCGQDAACRSQICEDGVCVEPCDQVAGGSCPEPFECRPESGGGPDVCGPELPSDGGCALAARDARTGSGIFLILVLAGLAQAARRRKIPGFFR